MGKKKIFCFSVLLLSLFMSLNCLSVNLSKQTRISIVTCSPGNEVYSVYGHSAIRVHDPAYGLDRVYNYGIFDFDSPNFMYRFAAGQTDYLLCGYKFSSFLRQYRQIKHSVYEQELNLTQSEKQKIFDFLEWNAKPENRLYRYNFFFDNCATKVRDVVIENIDGGVTFRDKGGEKSFRTLLKEYHSRLAWLSFGIDFLVSADADRTATFQEEMFLPFYMKNHFASAIRTDNGEAFVKQTRVLLEYPELNKQTRWFFGPFACFGLLFVLVAFFTVKQLRKGKMKSALDYILYGINGLAGLLLLWFTLCSEHPAMSPNYNLMWLIPLSLPFSIIWCVKKWRSVLKYYHLIFSVWLIIFIAISFFLPQKFHPVFYVMIATFLSRSLAHSKLILAEKNRP